MLCRVTLLAVLAGLTMGCGTLPSKACVKSECEFHVDGAQGADTATGTASDPYRTIARAQLAVRELLESNPEQNITVSIRAGRYYFDAPLRFDGRDSPAPGYVVTYKGYADERPELIGGKPLAGWKACGDGVYRAPMRSATSYRHLVENGVPAVLARVPNTGYWAAGPGSSSVKDYQYAELVIREEDDPGTFDVDDTQVVVWGGQHKDWDGGKNFNWAASILPVRGYDPESRMLALRSDSQYTLHERNRYYLRGARVFLDAPGEFHVDRTAGEVYYLPRNTPIENQHIVLATTPHVLLLQSATGSAAPARITFDGLDICVSGTSERLHHAGMYDEREHDFCSGLVQLENAREITVRNCRLRAAGLNAIGVFDANQGHHFENNIIADAANSGLMFSGPSIGDPRFNDEKAAYINKNHHVLNNWIRRCGLVVGHGSGVEIHQAGDIEIAHNLFEDMPRYGIGVYTSVLSVIMNPHGEYKGRVYGKPVNRQNYADFNFSRRIHVHHNEFRRVMQDSQDGGAINFYGAGAGNRIENNFVHHVQAGLPEGILVGIYLDDACNGFTVRNNIVARIGGSKYCAPMMVKGVGNEVYNNILADNASTWGLFHVLETPVGDFDFLLEGSQTEATDSLSFHHNIVYRNGTQDKPDSLYSISPWTDTIIAESDFNILWHPNPDFEVKNNWRPEPFEAWKSRLDCKYDQNTVIADPLFVDANNMDFRLQPDSPALAAGFEPIDMDAIGLREDFPFSASLSTGRER